MFGRGKVLWPLEAHGKYLGIPEGMSVIRFRILKRTGTEETDSLLTLAMGIGGSLFSIFFFNTCDILHSKRKYAKLPGPVMGRAWVLTSEARGAPWGGGCL